MPIGGVPAPTHWQETCLDIHMWLISNCFLFAQTLLQVTRQLNQIILQVLQNIFNSSNKTTCATKTHTKISLFKNHFYNTLKNTLLLISINFLLLILKSEMMTKRARSAEHQKKCHTVPLNAVKWTHWELPECDTPLPPLWLAEAPSLSPSRLAAGIQGLGGEVSIKNLVACAVSATLPTMPLSPSLSLPVTSLLFPPFSLSIYADLAVALA